MGILKKELNNSFVQVPNEAIEDDISANAFRVYVYLLSRPDNWQINNSDLKNKLNIKSNETIAKCFKELVTAGWIDRTKRTDEAGRFIGGYDYIIYNERGLKNPVSENFQIRKKSTFGKIPKHINTDLNTNTKNNTNTDYTGKNQQSLFNQPKYTEDKNCLFRNSSVANFDDFKSFFQKEADAGVDIYHYFEVTKNWSEAKGVKRKSWIAQARNIMLSDKNKGKLVTSQPGGEENSYLEFLNM